MQTVKTYVHSDGTATITCPVCSNLKRTSVTALKYEKHVLKVRCSCNTVFRVLLDYRSHYRKPVNLSGTYTTRHQYKQCKGLTQITNISTGGLQYRVVGLNRLHPGNILDLDFQLDDKQCSPIKKQALVRYTHKNVVGCEFIDKSDFDRALAFYLRL